MSYSMLVTPDAYNLTSTMRDIMIGAIDNVNVKILIGTEVIIEENYTVDSDRNIYVREIGKLLNNYLSGSGFASATQSNIVKQFTLKVNDDVIGTYSVLKCLAYTDVEAANFFDGNVFLHLMKQVKRTTPIATEYLTISLTDTNSVKVFVTYLSGNVYVNSAEEYILTPSIVQYRTLDVSFKNIAPLFPGIAPENILAYRVKLDKEISVFMVDRQLYLLPLEFRFKNSFDVPETLMSRGTANRKGKTSFDTSTVRSVVTKYNVVRNDEFEVTSGKIFSLNDYDRYREMFNSEDVEINFQGKWRKIIVTEENSNVGLRMGSLQPISFTFVFADKVDNNVITGESFMRWILEYGKWTDENMWLDPEHWIDS